MFWKNTGVRPHYSRWQAWGQDTPHVLCRREHAGCGSVASAEPHVSSSERPRSALQAAAGSPSWGAGDRQGAVPSPQPCPGRMGEIRNNQGEREKRWVWRSSSGLLRGWRSHVGAKSHRRCRSPLSSALQTACVSSVACTVFSATGSDASPTSHFFPLHRESKTTR